MSTCVRKLTESRHRAKYSTDKTKVRNPLYLFLEKNVLFKDLKKMFFYFVNSKSKFENLNVPCMKKLFVLENRETFFYYIEI